MVLNYFPLTILRYFVSSYSVDLYTSATAIERSKHTVESNGDGSDNSTSSMGQCASTAAIAAQQVVHYIHSFHSFPRNGMLSLMIGLA